MAELVVAAGLVEVFCGGLAAGLDGGTVAIVCSGGLGVGLWTWCCESCGEEDEGWEEGELHCGEYFGGSC